MKKTKSHLRSEKFNYFTEGQDPKEKRKSKLKKIWRWTKIVLYVLIFGLTLTGCVQSFVIPSSTTTGNAIEIYLDKDKVAPHVTTLKVDKETIASASGDSEDKTTTNLSFEVIKIDDLVNRQITDKKVISDLRDKTKNEKGEYGKYDSYSSAISIYQNSDKQYLGEKPENYLYSKNGNYLFMSDTAQEYNPINTFTNIYLVAQAGTKDKDSNSLKPGGAPNITLEFGDHGRIIGITGLAQISNDFTNPKDKFSRDILQTFYNESISKWDVTQYLEGLTPSEFIKVKIYDKIVNGEIPELTKVQYDILNKYNSVISSYLSAVNIGYNSDQLMTFTSFVVKAENNENEDKVEGATSTTTNKEETNKPLELSINKSEWENNNKFKTYDAIKSTSLTYAGDRAQKVLTTWGDSWALGPFYGLFIYPLAALMQSMSIITPIWAGWGSIWIIVFAVVVTKTLALAISFKSRFSQSIQDDLRVKKAAIEAKYKGFENNKQMKMRKSQELSALYSKNNINPMDSMANMIITMPIFIAIWRALQITPEIKSTFWLTINFASTSYQKVFEGHWPYLILIVVAAVVQIVSQILPRLLNRKKENQRLTTDQKAAIKKSEKTQRVMMVVFLFFTIAFTAGIQIYWIASGIWTILETTGIHLLKKTKWYRLSYSKKFKK